MNDFCRYEYGIICGLHLELFCLNKKKNLIFIKIAVCPTWQFLVRKIGFGLEVERIGIEILRPRSWSFFVQNFRFWGFRSQQSSSLNYCVDLARLTRANLIWDGDCGAVQRDYINLRVTGRLCNYNCRWDSLSVGCFVLKSVSHRLNSVSMDSCVWCFGVKLQHSIRAVSGEPPKW